MKNMRKIWEDPEFPSISKSVEINDFVINTEEVESIEICSVGIVTCKEGDNVLVHFIGKNKVCSVCEKALVVIDVYRTGKQKGTTTKPFKYKICNICHIIKNQQIDFDNNQNDKQGRRTTRPSCKMCRIEIDGKDLLKSEKARMLAIKPQPQELFVCPICQKVSIPDITAQIVIDHDHRTGMARKWICDSCNTGLGRFQDNLEVFDRITEYIKSYLD